MARKQWNWTLLGVGVLSLLGIVVVFAYMRKVNQDAAVPGTYEEALVAAIRSQQAQQDPLVTYIPEGLRGTDEVPEVSPTDPVYGDPNAQVTIIAFNDFECPACADLHPLLVEAVDDSNSTVRLVWKDFPIPRIHKNSEAAAEAARCAGAQGKFWEYAEDLFANQLLLGEQVYAEAAREENLDSSEFQSCRASDETLPLVQRDYLVGRSFQVDETPTLYVGRRRIEGVTTAAEIQQALDQAFGRI